MESPVFLFRSWTASLKKTNKEPSGGVKRENSHGEESC
jgi:hypothetical protein